MVLHNTKRRKKAFTLLEILLVIAAIGILAAIVIVAINPQRQLSLVRNTTRSSDINSIQSAAEQYTIDHGAYPSGITSEYQDICLEGQTEDCVDLDILIPTYLAQIPEDPNGGSYQISINPENQQVSVWAKDAELDERIAINPVLFATGVRDTELEIGSGFDDEVRSVAVQDNGAVLVGGDFENYQGEPAPRIARLNPDGSLDSEFMANIGSGFNSDVYSISLQDDEKIVVGGVFWEYQGQDQNGMVRLNEDGSFDELFDIGTGFDSSFGGQVYTTDIQADGKILAGGFFDEFDGESVSGRVARLNTNGSFDDTFGLEPSMGSLVYDLEVREDGNIWGGGDSDVGLADEDGSADEDFELINPAFGGSPIYSVAAAEDGKVLVGGSIWSYAGEDAGPVIRLNADGTLDESFNVRNDLDEGGFVYDMHVQDDGRIFVVGEVSQDWDSGVFEQVIRLHSDGSLDESFDVGTGFDTGWVNSIFMDSDGDIVVGGSFNEYRETLSRNVVKLTR